MADKLPLKAGESVFQNVNQSPRHRPEVKKSSFFTTVEGGGNSLKFSEDTDGNGNGRRGSGAGSGGGEERRGSGSGTSTPDSTASPRRPRKPMGSFFNTVEVGHDTFQFPSERGEGRGRRNGSNNGRDQDIYQSPKRTPHPKSSMFATVEGGGNSLQFDSERPKQPAKPANGTDVTDSPRKSTPEGAAEVLFDVVDGGKSTLEFAEAQAKMTKNPSPVFDEIDHSKPSPRHKANPLTHSDDEPEPQHSSDKSPVSVDAVDGPAVQAKPKKEPVDWVMYNCCKMFGVNGARKGLKMVIVLYGQISKSKHNRTFLVKIALKPNQFFISFSSERRCISVYIFAATLRKFCLERTQYF